MARGLFKLALAITLILEVMDTITSYILLGRGFKESKMFDTTLFRWALEHFGLGGYMFKLGITVLVVVLCEVAWHVVRPLMDYLPQRTRNSLAGIIGCFFCCMIASLLLAVATNMLVIVTCVGPHSCVLLH